MSKEGFPNCTVIEQYVIQFGIDPPEVFASFSVHTYNQAPLYPSLVFGPGVSSLISYHTISVLETGCSNFHFCIYRKFNHLHSSVGCTGTCFGARCKPRSVAHASTSFLVARMCTGCIEKYSYHFCGGLKRYKFIVLVFMSFSSKRNRMQTS